MTCHTHLPFRKEQNPATSEMLRMFGSEVSSSTCRDGERLAPVARLPFGRYGLPGGGNSWWGEGRTAGPAAGDGGALGLEYVVNKKRDVTANRCHCDTPARRRDSGTQESTECVAAHLDSCPIVCPSILLLSSSITSTDNDSTTLPAWSATVWKTSPKSFRTLILRTE